MPTSDQPSPTTSSQLPPPTLPSVFDSYICKEPIGDAHLLIHNGPDEYTALVSTLQRSAEHFSEKNQLRTLERIQFEKARLHMINGEWHRALRILVPLWQNISWRRSGWWQLLQRVDLALQKCARHVNDADTLIAVQWELLNQSLTPIQNSSIDLADAVKDIGLLKARPRPKLRAENVLSCVSTGFAFESKEGHVGIPLRSQLVLTSHASSASHPMIIQQIRIAFEGGLKDVQLNHDSRLESKRSPGYVIQEARAGKAGLDASPGATSPESSAAGTLRVGSANLELAPGDVSIISLTGVPRDAGELEVSSITLVLNEEQFDLEVFTTDNEYMQQEYVFGQDDPKPRARQVSRNSNAARILPKPPKLEIEFLGLETDNFVDEKLMFDLNILNGEDDAIDISLDARILEVKDMAPSMAWMLDDNSENPLLDGAAGSNDEMQRQLGIMAASEVQSLRMSLQAPPLPGQCRLEIAGSYSLRSDPDTPVLKTMSIELHFKQAFETTTIFLPLMHPDPWPSYFVSEDAEDDTSNFEGDDEPDGLIQRWSAVSSVKSLTSLALVLTKVEVEVVHIENEAQLTSWVHAEKPVAELPPNDVREYRSILDFRKIDLEDRRSSFVDSRLKISWSREDSPRQATISYLAVPELTVAFGEPRVLATTQERPCPSDTVQADYTIENPSIYNLTFSITMETSDDFAFSGAKSVIVRLVPLSRQTVCYNLLPLVRDSWITPQLRVYDTQFHKTLKIQGTAGMKSDRRGVSVWIGKANV